MLKKILLVLLTVIILEGCGKNNQGVNVSIDRDKIAKEQISNTEELLKNAYLLDANGINVSELDKAKKIINNAKIDYNNKKYDDVQAKCISAMEILNKSIKATVR